MKKNAALALSILLLPACGAPAAPDVGFVEAKLPAPPEDCSRVDLYRSGLEKSGCTTEKLDGASCSEATAALDACYADPDCRLAYSGDLLDSCRGLSPYWPCIGSPNYGECLRAQ